jgi:hypothetical protein
MKPRMKDDLVFRSAGTWRRIPIVEKYRCSGGIFASNTGCGLVLRQTSGAASFQPLPHIIHHARDTFQGVFDVGAGCCLIFVYAGTSGTDAIAYASRISHCFGCLWRKIEKAESAGDTVFSVLLGCQQLRPVGDVSFSHSRDGDGFR